MEESVMSNLNGQQEFDRVKLELLERFETMLRSDQSVDAANREDLVDALDRAIDAGRALPNVDGDLANRLAAGLNGAQGALVQVDQKAVVDNAFQVPFEVLQSESVKRAMEFAEIVRSKGEGAAREWLSRQQNAPASPAQMTIDSGAAGWAAIGVAQKLGSR
ncbi:hypothetical protein AO715_01095 [Xanthomonas sp. Mitacek01]|nr:hypothetical protein AO715_01095 [Xanthomonas sp. Mitacek01]